MPSGRILIRLVSPLRTIGRLRFACQGAKVPLVRTSWPEKMITVNPLGDRIRTLRKEKSLTLEQLAEQSGSSKSYIWELENKNPPRPSAEKLSKIADKLGTTIEFLLQGESSQQDAADAHFYRSYQKMDEPTKAKIRRMVELWGDDE